MKIKGKMTKADLIKETDQSPKNSSHRLTWLDIDP